MNIEEKRKIILERVSIIENHANLMQLNIDGGYQNKEGQPSFESLIQDAELQKEALINALNDLS
jgi:hypothetical protein